MQVRKQKSEFCFLFAAEMKSYRETVFSRSIPFTMIEARAILSKLRKWKNTIRRRSSAQNSSEFFP
ncbi:MAG: hypothetical protein KAV25_04070 [Methanophagales archaeon]|nr:hypothetical protein [Methanophagales archaeon]